MTAATSPAQKKTFRDHVRAEELPTQFTWAGRDWVALLSVPAIFLTGWLVSLFTHDAAVGTVVDTTLRIGLFIALVTPNRAMLARHWRAYRAAPWRSTWLVLAGVVGIQAVVTLLGNALRPLASSGTATPLDDASTLTLGVTLFASLSPVVTALIEDFTFRHTLLLKFPVWNTFFLAATLVIVNAVVFGAIHINNFGGHWVLTLSYAGAGLLMNLVYLWTRNIWHVLLMHGINNFILGGPVTILLLHIMQATTGNQ